MKKVYVVAASDSIRGIYCTWQECKAALESEHADSRKHQWVDSCETARAMLDGTGVELPRGTYAFTDGNSTGGVGIVHVEQEATGFSVNEIHMSVTDVFQGAGVPGLDSESAVLEALGRRRHGLTELAAPYYVLREAERGSSFTIVYDRKAVGELLEHRWTTSKPEIAALVRECDRFQDEHHLDVAFKPKNSHQKEVVGRDDFAHWNNRADQMADQKVPPDDFDRWFSMAGLRRRPIAEGRYRFEVG